MKLLSFLLLTVFVAGAADERSYQKAMSLIDQRRWEEAARLLKVEAEQAGGRNDAALYWSAYIKGKQGEMTQALADLQVLKTKFAASAWINDAKALELELNQSAGKPVSPEAQADEDLKLMAIQGLMHSDAERAVPLLEGVLAKSTSMKLKRQALFVLAQSGSPKAQELIGKIARGNANPDLQRSAIHNLGIGGKRNAAMLSEIYASAPDVGVKREILQSFMIMGDRERLETAAKSEKDEDLRSRAINLLGMAGGREALVRLYAADSSVKVKKEILRGLFVGGAAKEIVELARKEPAMELKKEAVRHLSLMNSKDAADFLGDLLK